MRIKQGVLKVDSIEDFLKRFGECVAVIDARYVIDLENVKFAVEKAIKSWERGERISRSLTLEILLYFTATRQIKDAIKVGLKEGVNEVVLVLLNGCDGLERYFEEREVVRVDEERIENVRKIYGITDEELKVVGVEKLPLLIRERIALFSVFKE